MGWGSEPSHFAVEAESGAFSEGVLRSESQLARRVRSAGATGWRIIRRSRARR